MAFPSDWWIRPRRWNRVLRLGFVSSPSFRFLQESEGKYEPLAGPSPSVHQNARFKGTGWGVPSLVGRESQGRALEPTESKPT